MLTKYELTMNTVILVLLFFLNILGVLIMQSIVKQKMVFN